MANIGLTERGLQEVTKELSTTAGAPPKLFCQSWPVAKQVLAVLGKTTNVWLKMAVNLVLQVGNMLYKKCGV